MFRQEQGSGRSSRPAPQKVARQVTMRAKPSPIRRIAAPVRRVVRKAPVRRAPVYHAPKPVYHPPARRSAPKPKPQPRRVVQTKGAANFSHAAKQANAGGNNRPRNPGGAGPGKVNGPGRKPAPKPAPKKPGAPSIDKYLRSDANYNQGLSELMRTLDQYKAGNADSRGDVQEAFKTAMQRMGEEKTKSLQGLQEDFASRGLLTSGLYTQSVSDYDKQYGDRVSDMTRDQQNQTENLNRDLSNYQSLTKSKQADLKLDAIRRRAEKYGIR